MRRVSLDIETTGLDPYEGHKIVEIGCAELENNFPTGRTWQAYINPERKMPTEAYEIHGLTDEFLAPQKKFYEIADEFLNFIKGSELLIHNAKFDLKFINFELELINLQNLSNYAVIDTLELAKKIFPGTPSNLDSLCRRYKIDLHKRTKHGALLDAELLAEVFLEMQGGRQQGIALRKIEKRVDKHTSPLNINYSRKINDPSEEEQDNHKKLLNKIKNNLWKNFY